MTITTAVYINYSPRAQARKLYVFMNGINRAVFFFN
jgi:hypothetical protein